MANSIENNEELKVELERLVRETERFCREEAESVRLRHSRIEEFVIGHREQLPDDIVEHLKDIAFRMQGAEFDLCLAEGKAKTFKI